MKTPPPNPWALVKKVTPPDPKAELIKEVIDPAASDEDILEAQETYKKSPYSPKKEK